LRVVNGMLSENESNSSSVEPDCRFERLVDK
jgi:hypothetical protein